MCLPTEICLVRFVPKIELSPAKSSPPVLLGHAGGLVCANLELNSGQTHLTEEDKFVAGSIRRNRHFVVVVPPPAPPPLPELLSARPGSTCATGARAEDISGREGRGSKSRGSNAIVFRQQMHCASEKQGSRHAGQRGGRRGLSPLPACPPACLPPPPPPPFLVCFFLFIVQAPKA